MITAYGLRLDHAIDRMAGSYLRTVRYTSVGDFLCPRCGGFKSPAYPCCRSCHAIEQQADAKNMGDKLADRTAISIYAQEHPSSQAMKMMYGYKDEHPASPDYRRNVKAIIALALQGHGECLREAAGPIDAWAMIPSTKSSRRYGKPHPLHDILNEILKGIPEIPLQATGNRARGFNPDLFALADPWNAALLRGHVLLVDDSWVTGGNVQSAAARLKLEGASGMQVSAYCVARVVDMAFLNSLDKSAAGKFNRSVHYTGGYCPWHRRVELPATQ
ncbi:MULTISPECIES: hypothetical protein [Bifidobacterium]|jgi:hypothetical protein|uniref:hypothetical protein n=1 Tax=Bifidobacterium TaxID=1678 RepID=UPI0026EA8291|nr:hypothetical protein [Bifidobacterium tibiigranuli]MCI2186214.1 hypothetical protein [Bifidobacterium tibiigranuli]MCI2203959.1 hypothetical protein [Bifidobacterium tibiigranuli]